MSSCRIEQGDNLEVLKRLIAERVFVDAVVTDPPYALNFMGAKWDIQVPSVDFWKPVLQILKPGGHLLAFGGTRTYHRMVGNIEDAGFAIRDCITWLYGSGMPKSLDISKAIDKAASAERQVIGTKKGVRNAAGSVTLNQIARPNGTNNPDAKVCGAFGVGAKSVAIDFPVTAPATPEAILWDGWGTGLKPAAELIVLARKPLSEKTVAANILKWGTGALSIDGCRIGTGTGGVKPVYVPNGKNNVYGKGMGGGDWENTRGRWPANVIFDEEAAALLDQQEAGASRFFYCAKASKKERRGSKHPTVKPLDLMQYLCRLVTPPGGTVLDPFAGTGSTGEAARLEGFNSILIEKEPVYIEDIRRRIGTETQKEPTTKEGAGMSTTKRDDIGTREEIGRDEHGRRLVDCLKCDRKGTPEAGFGLCYRCYRQEKRAQKPRTHMHAPGQQKEQIRLTKLYTQMITGAIGLGMDEDEIRQLQMLLQPYLDIVPRLLNTADISFLFDKDSDEPESVNSSQAAA